MDRTVVPIHFNELMYEQTRSSKLRIGYIDSITPIPSTGAVKRSIELVRQKLEIAGHTMVKIDLPAKFQ